MKAKLVLILRGQHFQEHEILLPQYDESTPFRVAQELRSEFVKWKIKEFISTFHRQIDKCEGRYEIYLVAESAGNKFEYTEKELAA